MFKDVQALLGYCRNCTLLTSNDCIFEVKQRTFGDSFKTTGFNYRRTIPCSPPYLDFAREKKQRRTAIDRGITSGYHHNNAYSVTRKCNKYFGNFHNIARVTSDHRWLSLYVQLGTYWVKSKYSKPFVERIEETASVSNRTDLSELHSSKLHGVWQLF